MKRHDGQYSVINYMPLEERNFSDSSQVPHLLAEQLVDDVIGKVQKDDGFEAKLSSSECQIRRKLSKNIRIYNDDSNEDMDPRLKCWNKMLRERRLLQDRIERRTGKRAEDVLFNRHATIDEQSKRMLIHVMDTAERRDVEAPPRAKGVLKMRQDDETCCMLEELKTTDPKIKNVEFVGLPFVTKLELAATLNPPESQWMRSNNLSKRLDEQVGNIKKVLQYCPEIDNLQVTTAFIPTVEPVPDSKIVAEDFMYKISSDTISKQSEMEIEIAEPASLVAEPCPIPITTNVMNINGLPYAFGDNAGTMSNEIHLYFQCDPFQRVRKTLAHFHNVGIQFIQVRFSLSNDHKLLPEHRALRSEFIFDSQPFVLQSGEERCVDVLYQPLTVGIKTQLWSVHMQRSLVCGTRRVLFFLHGLCTQPRIFRRRVLKDQDLLIEKRKRQIADKLAIIHAELAPLVQPPDRNCPYQRVMNERELFCVQNPGFCCERYSDLETLKELYQLVKKPRQHAWDYRLDTLRQCIYQHEVQQRQSLQKILNEVLEPLRCNSNEGYLEEQSNQQRERSCFLYVRGVVSSAIEEWEEISEGLGQQFFKSEMQLYLSELEENEETLPIDSEYVDWLINRRVLSRKNFRDSLYIQTYTILCDTVENIVSAIESTSVL